MEKEIYSIEITIDNLSKFTIDNLSKLDYDLLWENLKHLIENTKKKVLIKGSDGRELTSPN